MIVPWLGKTRIGTRVHLKRVLWLIIAGFTLALIAAQFVYPSDRMPLYSTVDGIDVSGWSKPDVIRTLDGLYSQKQVDIYFGTDPQPYRSPSATELGITPINQARIDSINYPWYVRIIPGSVLWMHYLIGTGSPDYIRDSQLLDSYVKKELGDSCSVTPKNASIAIKDATLVVVKNEPGGICKQDDVISKLTNIQLHLFGQVSVQAPVTIVPASVNDTDAQNMIDQISTAIAQGVTVSAGGQEVLILKNDLLSWLDFDNSGNSLTFSFNSDRAGDYLRQNMGNYVAVSAGVTQVTTHDFVEVSRQTGVSGQTLDVVGTLASMKAYVTGESKQAVAITAPVAPQIQYNRTYSPTDTGLSALIQNYAQSHAGTYGVSLTELSGQYRRATYSSTKSFTTASTYKLFVAYSTLKRVEAGTWNWTDPVQGGRDLAKCFDDMIVLSDNDCGSTLLAKIGYTAITNEVRAIGCNNTSFLGSDGIKTTPEDLALLLAELQTGQILSQQTTRDILINAMKRQVYRQGIPKGISGSVADKVGFLDALLHDAAIVYATTGPYVLVIMTDGSSWANIADLTRQIEALRIQ
jgi:beta-lactamase class A